MISSKKELSDPFLQQSLNYLIIIFFSFYSLISTSSERI